MEKKPLLEVLQDRIDEHLRNLSSTISDPFRTVKNRVEARSILGVGATPEEINALESELLEQERKQDELIIRKEYYYLKVMSGLLDMIEAVTYRYEDTSKDTLTKGMLDSISELFYNGKRTLLTHARWLQVIEEDSFTKEWPNFIDPVLIDTFTTYERWMEFFDQLPM